MVQMLHKDSERRKTCKREERGSRAWRGWSCGRGARCMIKAYILKSLTSPLVWLMMPASHSDGGKGLEKWCNYYFLNRGLKRPAWKEDLEEIPQRILDSHLLTQLFPLPHTHTHTETPRHYSYPSPLRLLSSNLMACFTSALQAVGAH